MIRRKIERVRPNAEAALDELEFDWRTLEDGDPYWDERAYWEFTSEEVDELEEATNTLHEIAQVGVDSVIKRGLLPLYGYDAPTIELIEHSWHNRSWQPTFYGRFDLSYDGTSSPKLLEYNGDTPTSLYEASVVQWHWLQDAFPDADQFNSIHEKLRESFTKLYQFEHAKVHDDNWQAPVLYTTSIAPHPEDEGQLRYLRSVAEEAHLESRFIDVTQIGWRSGDEGVADRFVDEKDRDIRLLFKLIPWEWLLEDPFGKQLRDEVLAERVTLMEPAWKMVLSNKRFLADLWELFPQHPNLLPAYTDKTKLAGQAYVEKPWLGREGANVEIVDSNGVPLEWSDGPFSKDGVVYQEFTSLATADGNHAVIGSWVIDGKSAGIGVRESSNLITSNTSTFVPHLFR